MNESHHCVACLLQHLANSSAKAALLPPRLLRIKIKPRGWSSLLDHVPEAHTRRLIMRLSACVTAGRSRTRVGEVCGLL